MKKLIDGIKWPRPTASDGDRSCSGAAPTTPAHLLAGPGEVRIGKGVEVACVGVESVLNRGEDVQIVRCPRRLRRSRPRCCDDVVVDPHVRHDMGAVYGAFDTRLGSTGL